MNNQKKLALLLAACMTVLALVGCGGKKNQDGSQSGGASISSSASQQAEPLEDVTAESLAQKVAEVTRGKSLTQIKTVMEMDVTMSSQGASMTMLMDMVSQAKMSADPYLTYMETESFIEMDGQQMTEGTQSYIQLVDDQLVTYVHLNSTDEWTWEEVAVTPELLEAQTDEYGWLENKTAEELTLEEGTQALDGHTVYVLRCTLTGDEMMEAAGAGGVNGLEEALAVGGVETADFSALTMPTTIYIDAETYLPLKREMEILGMSELMNSLAASANADMQMTINTVKVEASGMSYEPVEVPTVPAEVTLKKEQENFEPDQGNGVYIIQESGSAAKFTTPGDWSVAEATYDNLFLEHANGRMAASCTIYVDVDGTDFSAYVNEEEVQTYTQQSMYESHGTGSAINGFETMWVKCDGMNMYYAWAPMGDAWLFVQMMDYAGQSLESALTPLLNGFQPHQL